MRKRKVPRETHSEKKKKIMDFSQFADFPPIPNAAEVLDEHDFHLLQFYIKQSNEAMRKFCVS